MNKYIYLLKQLLCISVFCIFACKVSAAEFIQDDFVNESLKDRTFEEAPVNIDYNYESTYSIPIKLRYVDKITTKKNIREGDILIFKVERNVLYRHRIILKKDTIVKARLKTYMTRGWGGLPGQVIIDDFDIPDIDSRKIKSTYIKKGMNLTLLLLPVKWVLTPIPFAGSFVNLIVGGHAKLTPRDIVVLYYYPEWDM